ncbi:MAG: metallophosphoesterase [Clostridia bacterium]|nr:metallophosphoesterase [Clostridia bacterium]
MKYYVISDIHGFYTPMINALTEKGFFEDKEPSKLIICGDLLDRGEEGKQVIDFVLEMMAQDRVILIRGNHEDLLEDLIDQLLYGDIYDLEMECSHHNHNGTWRTALELTGFSHANALARSKMMANFLKNSVFYKKIMSQMLDYYETNNYIFVHGYIPCYAAEGDTVYRPYKRYYLNKEWRRAPLQEWRNARWYNGMEFACKRGLRVENKTVVCGHWHTSYGHAWVDHRCSEFGKDADFSPFYHDGVIALDGCTKHSGVVNCIVLED